MPQFVMGFWCGCLVTALLGCMFFLYKKRQREKQTDETEKNLPEETTGQGYKMSFSAPGVRLLLVDDSKLSRKIIKEFLGQTEIEIVEAENGEECLKLAGQGRFDLILLDQMMPGMDGTETLQRLRKIDGYGTKVPVVVVSSAVRKENREEYVEKGFAECLGKPIQGKRLEDLLLRLLPAEKLLREPDGFSYRNGLKNFDGNEAVYRETLVLFATLWEERRAQLKQFLEKENAEEYAILIHAIKGDARTLGADIFAKMAYEHELKAKARELKWISENFEQVVKMGDKTAEYFKQTFSE